jgi:hypothetical protein
LKGFAIGDTARRYTISTDVSVPPAGRAILCEDSSAFVNFYGNSDCPVVYPGGWSRLDNLGDFVIIENDLGALSDSLRYVGSPVEGFSWERDEDSTGGAFATQFYQSTDTSGASPCRPNSARKLPPQNDLGIPTGGFSVTASSDLTPVEFRVTIWNYGYLTSAVSALDLYDDLDFDSLAEDAELIEQSAFAAIAARDSLTLTMHHQFARGQHSAICMLPLDENAVNNSSYLAFSVGPLTREIIITEFLANPGESLETEWVEAKNVSGRTINLHGWMFGDSLHQYTVDCSETVTPGQYFVMAQDTTAFRQFYGDGCVVIGPSNWSNLNNGGDAIILRDNNNVVADSLTFSEVGDGNHSVELSESGDERNWYISTASSGATPCAANSVSGVTVDQIEVSLRNRVFAPRLGEQLGYRISCPPATAFTIEVFDLAGRKQYSIAQSLSLSTGDYLYAGQSDHYGTLPPGAYILKIESENGKSYSRKIGFAVAHEQ